MNILFNKHFFVGFMVSEIPRVSVFGYFPLCVNADKTEYNSKRISIESCIHRMIINNTNCIAFFVK